MKFTPSPFHRRALALAIGTIIGAASQTTLATESLGRGYVDGLNEQVEVFVRLGTPSVSELNVAALRSTGSFASREAQMAQAARVDAEQAAVRPQLAALGATELSTQRVGANGFRVAIRAGDVASLEDVPGVVSVGLVEQHTVDNAESAPWIGSTAVAAAHGARGEGITIAVIDTGIDYTHANFGGPGTVAAYTGNVRNVIEPGTFPTAKVIDGFDFAGPTYSAAAGAADPTPDPDPDPIDVNGHGSHVSGSAAGFGVTGAIGAGVAPQASLVALKVFGDVAGSTGLTSLAIERAMDPNGDGDMSDHVDVINMSLGSNFGSVDDPSSISSDNASAVGIIVVTSAGNSGPIPYVTGAPGVAHTAISTAANVPGGRNFATLSIDAPAGIAGSKFNEEGSSPARVSSVAPLTDTVVEGVPLDGCTPYTNAAAINGNIVLVQRGGTPAACAFALKAQNALAAGARAMLAFNNVAGDPIVMGAVTAPIPGVMVSLADGLAIAAQATTDAASPVTATFGFGPDPTKVDRIAGFSSRGPGIDGSNFKPDLSAPGVAIISTGVGTGNGPAPNQGTSMASPHVAGAAALLRQLHEDLPPAGIKALLQNSTVNGNGSGDTALARHGVGAVRVDRAANLSSYASPGGVSFGRLNPAAPINVNQTVVLNDLAGAGPRTYAVTHAPQQTYPGVTVSCPSSVTVGSHGTRSFKIGLKFDPNASAAAGAFDNASISQREVDGWCVLNDGVDTLRVGYLAVVDAASRLKFVHNLWHGHDFQIRNQGPAPGFAEGFTFVGSSSTGSDGTYGSICQLGVRLGNPASYLGDNVVEFAIAVDKSWEHVFNLNVDLFLDTNKDGTDDVRIVGRDWTKLQSTGTLGTYITAQFVVGGAGFLDWIATGWDFNDRVMLLPFTLASSGGLVQNSFNYRLVLAARDGTTDVQTGTIDLANLVGVDLDGVGLDAGESVTINVTENKGQLLWLFPTNTEATQTVVSSWVEPAP